MPVLCNPRGRAGARTGRGVESWGSGLSVAVTAAGPQAAAQARRAALEAGCDFVRRESRPSPYPSPDSRGRGTYLRKRDRCVYLPAQVPSPPCLERLGAGSLAHMLPGLTRYPLP